MSKHNVDITEELLVQLYLIENKTVANIANTLNISSATVNRFLKKFGISKTEDQRRKAISQTKQNKTEEEKAEYSKHISKARKGKGLGRPPWNKGLRGAQVAWNKGLHTEGKPRTEESLAKARQTCLEKYGVDWACQRPEARLKGQNSKANLDFEQLLINNKIEYSREFPIGSYSYDFRVGKYLIEVNPYATHNSSWGIRGNQPKANNYHKIKAKLALENGYFCLHIFDWDDQNKIINRFISKTIISADACVVKEVDRPAMKNFLTLYHPQNYTSSLKNYGLYINDELVEIMTFSKPRYNKKYDWELTRVCAKAGYKIQGGCKKILDHFITEQQPNNIIVYCDMAKLDGKLYENLGFQQIGNTSPARHWYNPKVNKHYTDAFLWRKGFDRLFGTDYGKQASNTQLMLEHGFVEIYDCGQATYVWNNTKSE